jgi:arabinogalactan oligomer/maltooligosaccharide transport system permease protein
MEWGFIKNISGIIKFWGVKEIARTMVIIVNVWIGIPYTMLICTGILMNIPKDLYESSQIDGATAFQQFVKITMPYMLFVTGPYLLTSFIGNINNFNVIYLLTGGGPSNPALLTSGGSAGDTDLLITWLFNLTTGAESKYYLAAVIGIMIFVVVSSISVVVYNVMPSTKNEEDFS